MARTWIAMEASGTDIGVARLDLASSIPEMRSELKTLYIDTAWQGRGIGATVLDRVCAEVARLGALPMGIGVLADNVRGRRFYARHGARAIGERPAFEWDGQVVIETMFVMAE